MRDKHINRRQALASAGAIAALGGLWRPLDALADDPSGRPWAYLTLDVACLGDTFAANFGEALDAENGDMRGVGFFVEGYLYPAGTLPSGDAIDLSPFEATGHWLCRGWFMLHPDRPLPHVITTQEYLLGLISEDQPVPADQLVSSGVEGGVPVTTRSVLGGTGRYRHFGGEVIQEVIGTNTTVLNTIGEPAPNFRFSFKL